MARIIALVGLAGSGKTTLAQALAASLEWEHISIDAIREQGGDWPQLLTRVRLAQQPLMVESVLFTQGYRLELAAHDARMVHVRCQPAERLRRLEARGHRDRQGYTPTYNWRPGVRVNTTTPTTTDTIRRLAEWCSAPRHSHTIAA